MTRPEIVPPLRVQTWDVRHAGQVQTVAAGDAEAAARVWGWLSLDPGQDTTVQVVQGDAVTRWHVTMLADAYDGEARVRAEEVCDG